jgi:2-polyprenyl-6-methoxyphenol hydroxylase-like FAD-dependent oxidoreductase
MRSMSAQCSVVGGGPAGLMLGYLLARQGVEVILLEKHADFLRDFRGDTVHPSTLEVFHELGLLDGLLKRPHQKTKQVSLVIAGKSFTPIDFGRLPTHCKYIAMMPQWEFLDFLADEARRFSNFKLLMSTEAETLIENNGQITGVTASDADGQLEISAPLTVAADGRTSILRDQSGLEIEDLGAPIDVFWMRLARTPDDSTTSLGRVNSGGVLVQINRGDYWQCALPFPKGSAEEIRREGLAAFRARISNIAPNLSDAAEQLTSWDQIKLLSVQVNHLKKWWREGLLFIGDAAHAMSPVGGVGVNLAIQDAVASARILGPSLKTGSAPDSLLAAVQKRRGWPARMTQRAQVAAHDRILIPALSSSEAPRAPLALKLLDRFPMLRGLSARAVGLGLRPEHWHDPS